jgi:ABC-type oligopeptide transport system ATPase subunit
MTIIAADDLFRFYHPGDTEVRAVRGAIRSVDCGGTTVALVGPPGSRKSTLLACIAGLDEPNGGTVTTDGPLPSGPAVQIIYTSNSDPNPVTNKQIRLENERYLIAHNGKLATLTMSAPAGADNADQWKLMADSFRWN